MIDEIEYQQYLGVDTTPSNFKRIEFISLNELKSVMAKSVPTQDDLEYNDFKKALIEQMNYFVQNPDLIDSNGSGGYTLGSYSESSSSKTEVSKSIDRISPMAYDILLNIGLIYSGLGGCYYGKI